MANDAERQVKIDMVFRVWNPAAVRAAAAELLVDRRVQPGEEDYLAAAALIEQAVLSLLGGLADMGVEVSEVGIDFIYGD